MDKNAVAYLKSEGFSVKEHKKLKDKTVFIVEKDGVYQLGSHTSNRISVSSLELSLEQARQTLANFK
ncbi:hypothetical protein [Bacillus sonorensis]|uniref:hypothetical protein n=1 Tax=Bacillus sonorensis TaxID=119858 RepID=UPI002DBD1B02|nr:hypothetical protein [Bacillus sonorensis]MEC0342017.1 hypothetical protein [Bacillus sonorensis]MEC0457469.1 hypothetical protein [Bacillus sonorensis]MEC0530736.1 hypothetical protein [Bacillus sonorensis]